jgi:hypothetical protein
LGKANTKPKKLIGQFEEYTHYGELYSDTHYKRFYLKQKIKDETIYAWVVTTAQLEELKPDIKFHQAQELINSGILISYLGVDSKLPTMAKLNIKE